MGIPMWNKRGIYNAIWEELFMNGEFISIETANKIARLEKENQKLKKGLKKAINKLCEEDVVIAETIEYLESILDSMWIDEREALKRAIEKLKGDKNEIR